MSDRGKASPRFVALEHLLPQVTAFPNVDFDRRKGAAPSTASARPGADGGSDGTDLGAPIAGLAAAIERATIRHWLTAESIARPMCTRPWLEVQPPARAALLAGITQLLYMPAEPTHAVVNDVVEWTRGRLQRGAAGLVNAVLRRVADMRGERVQRDACPDWVDRRDILPLPDGQLLPLTEGCLPADPIARIAVQTSHPQALIARWNATRGLAAARQLALHGMLQMPLVLHDGREAAPEQLAGISGLAPHTHAGFFVHELGAHELADIVRKHPTVIVQDVASAQAVRSTRALAPTRILDACAGRGTKAVQLALLHPGAEVWATDPDPARYRALKERSAALPNLRACELTELGSLPRQFDLLLLDVPCSNTGVLARRVEARYRFSERSVADLVALQRAIATHHRGLVAERGHVLWSTCSLDPSENQEQVRFLVQHWKGQVVHEQEWVPQGSPGDPATARSDGSYHALIRLLH